MYKNAGIQSRKEAVQRLIDGEKFYWGGLELRFDPSRTNPFRAEESDLTGYWYYYKKWEVKFEWYENLGEGVLCWVWDDNEEWRQLRVITRYDSEAVSKFGTKNCAWFEHAEPMTSEEVKKFLWVGAPPALNASSTNETKRNKGD